MKDIDNTAMPLIDHLIELRARLMRCVVALAVSFVVCWVWFAEDIFDLLVRPLTGAFPPGQGKLIYTKLYEAFFVEVKVALFAAFFVSFPIISNQLWAFMAPGLYAREKRAFLPFLFATPVLFFSGAALAYFLVMPAAFKFFLAYQGEAGGMKLEALPGTGDYLALVMQFIFAFGISFLLPILLLLINRAGLVSRAQFARSRRYVIVAIFAFAAVITPPDVVSQMMLGIPLLLLFEASLVIMRVTETRAAKAAAEAASAEAASAGAASVGAGGEAAISRSASAPDQPEMPVI